MTANQKDEAAIQELIASQFASLKWSSTQSANWLTFEAGFVADAQLFPATRPVKPISVKSFITRMETLKTDGVLTSFREMPGPIKILVVGQVAVGVAGCEMVENEQAATRDISVFLLVKDEGTWKIAAQGWDVVKDFQSVAP